MIHCAGRLAAAVELEIRLANHPHKLALMEAMAKKQLDHFDSFIDKLLNELLITGRETLTSAVSLVHHKSIS